jgi:hypothetical protein
MGSIALASASIDAHSHFYALFQNSKFYISRIAQGVHKDQPAEEEKDKLPMHHVIV